MSETQELEHIAALFRANEKLEKLRALLKEAIAALEIAEEALIISGHASFGNIAMTAWLEVQETLAKIKRALQPPPAQEGE